MQFIYPQMFLLLFVPSLVLFYFMVTSRPKVLRIFSEEIYEKLSLAERSSMGRTTRMSLVFLALMLMIIAFARPVIDRGEKEVVAKGGEVVIGLDISKSMDTKDIYPTRLEASIQKVRDLLEQVRGDKVAIVAFAKDSYIVSPMTKDTRVARYLLDTLDLGRFEDRSSNMLAAVEAGEMLSTAEYRTLLMLSDGDEGELAEIRDAVKKSGMRVYAIGMAKEKGSPVDDGKGGYLNDPEGNIVISALNPALKEMALSSGGAYTDFSVSGADISGLYAQIRKDQHAEAFEKEKIRDFLELFYYPLGMAIFFLMIAFHSLPSKNLAAAMLLVTLGSDLHSASFDFGAMEQAKADYRSGKYEKAIEEYKKIHDLDHDSEAARLYNMGNAHYRLKQYDQAIGAYEESLKLDQNEDTRYNLERTKKAKQKQQEEQKKEQENNKEDQQKKEDDKEQSKKDQQKQEDSDQKKEGGSEEKKEPRKQQEEKQNDQKKAEDSKEKDEKSMEEREAQRVMRELEQKPNPIPLKKLSVTQGGKSAKYW